MGRHLRLLFAQAALVLASTAAPAVATANWIGMDFSFEPQQRGGDDNAPLHVFVHRYSMPEAGFLTHLRYLNDGDETPEAFDFLVLRPVAGGWDVIHRVSIPADDNPPAIVGITEVALSLLAVQAGDVFAHWQFGPGGPIPLNLEADAVEGRSVGRFGFQSGDITPGSFIESAGFSGARDYFLNVRFTAIPEPSSFVLVGLGLAWLAGYAGRGRVRCRRTA